jgi:3-deoxy-D-manno-octulosonate 8-phosphate phosphatase (KDO 8-P phosphatase)
MTRHLEGLDGKRGDMASVQIRLLVLDVDGVLTDGTILLLPGGDEARSVHFHDLDAVAAARRDGVVTAVLSGEQSLGAQRVARRFGISEAVFGARDKLAGLHDLANRLGFALAETCYVGDADRDVPALETAGLGLAPSDATPAAQAAADHVLTACGGHGAIAETMALLQRISAPVAGRETQ